MEGYRVVAIARMLILFADLAENRTFNINSGDNEIIQSVATEEDKSFQEAVSKSPLGKALEEITGTLSDIRTRAYVDAGRVDRSLSLLYSLLKEASGMGCCK